MSKFFENQKNAIVMLGDEFCNVICDEYKQVDKEKLLDMWSKLLECSISPAKPSGKCSAYTKAGTPCKSKPEAGKTVCKRHNGEVKAKSPSKGPQCAGATKGGSQCKKPAQKESKFCQMHTVAMVVEVKQEEVKEFVFNCEELNSELYALKHYSTDDDETHEYWVHLPSSICIEKYEDRYVIFGVQDGKEIVDYDPLIHLKMSNIEIHQEDEEEPDE